MNTIGVFSLHIFLARQLTRVPLEKYSEVIEGKIKDMLIKASKQDYPLSFWESRVYRKTKEQGRYAGAYSSSVGHKMIAEGLAGKSGA